MDEANKAVNSQNYPLAAKKLQEARQVFNQLSNFYQELAVPLLVQIIRSQQPTRDLGQKSYQQLLELGFVDAPFPNRATQPTK